MPEKAQQTLRHRRSGKSSPRKTSPSPVIHISGSPSSPSLSSDSLSDPESPLPIFELPQFTMKELLAAIPPHCFEPSAIRSSLYLAWDLLLTSSFIYLAGFIDPYFDSKDHYLVSLHPILTRVARFTAWALYGYASGLVWTGIWVIAHECGDQSFSTSKRLNNAVGLCLHSALLVAYHSWRISHAQHHAATGHLTCDQVFVPKTRSQWGLPPLAPDASKREREGTVSRSFYDKMDDLLEDAPFWNLLNLFLQSLVGWPAYLLTNVSGQFHYPAWTNHFNPNAIIFDKRHRNQVLTSNLVIGMVIGALLFLGYKTSFMKVFKYYIVPYTWVNHWIAVVTFIQHIDPLLPRYREGDYNFQRGALCTVDRKIHGFFFHGVAETHVVHHLCSKIPHYHAWEATEALRAKIGPHYHQTDEHWWISLWRNYTQCLFVEDEGDVVFFKNAKGQAAMRLGKNDVKREAAMPPGNPTSNHTSTDKDYLSDSVVGAQ